MTLKMCCSDKFELIFNMHIQNRNLGVSACFFIHDYLEIKRTMTMTMIPLSFFCRNVVIFMTQTQRMMNMTDQTLPQLTQKNNVR